MCDIRNKGVSALIRRLRVDFAITVTIEVIVGVTVETYPATGGPLILTRCRHWSRMLINIRINWLLSAESVILILIEVNRCSIPSKG